MKVRYTLRARSDLQGIYSYLDMRSPSGARSVKRAIERRIGWLTDFPFIAPKTDEPGVHELTIIRYPYKFIIASKETTCGFSIFVTHPAAFLMSASSRRS